VFIRSDNGPEFIAENFQTWLTRVGIKPIRIYPGSPWENGYNECFNGTQRREVLNAEWFTSIRQAQTVIGTWLKQYNHIRPHQELNMRPPNDYLFFNDIADRKRWVQGKVSRIFRVLCEHAKLESDAYGQKHTTYSLRHSALCFQILKTGGADLLPLAKNARTSIDMLEKFYLSHLTPQMPEFSSSLLTTRVLENSEI